MISDVLGRLRRGEVTAVAMVERQLELLRRAHAVTNGVAAFEDARALADAAALDRAFAVGGPVGPLHGLPVTVKDWIDVEGFPCAGETDDRDRRPAHDATVVRRLRAAGAVVVAKTRPWGGVAHPRDPARTVGGSSSGEAALVAAGASLLGLGSDSGGSIRLPAAWAGVCGLRPTFGRVPTTGHYPRVGPRSDGRTVIGPLAACVDDLELALTVIAGPDGRDMGAAPVPLRPSAGVFAAPTRPSGDLRAAARLGRPSHGAAGHLAARSDADAGVAGAVGSGPGAAGGGGAGAAGVGGAGSGGAGSDGAGDAGSGGAGAGSGVVGAGGAAAGGAGAAAGGAGEVGGLRVAVALGEGPWQPGPRVAAAVEWAADVLVAAGARRVPWEFPWLEPAWDITQRYWARAGGRAGLTGADTMRELEDWDRFAYRYLEATQDIDLVVAPATAGPAPPHGEIDGSYFVYLLPASLVGVPALALPAGEDGGLPVGVQVVGRPWEEAVVLAAGRVIERAAPAPP